MVGTPQTDPLTTDVGSSSRLATEQPTPPPNYDSTPKAQVAVPHSSAGGNESVSARSSLDLACDLLDLLLGEDLPFKE